MFLSWWSGKLLPTAFPVLSYDPSMKAPDHTPEAIAAVLNEKAEVARRYLDRCGVAVLEPEYAEQFYFGTVLQLINKHTSQHLRLRTGYSIWLGMYMASTMKKH